MIPNGIPKPDADSVNLSKAYLACNDFRGIDILQLQALMLKTVLDLYDAALANVGSSFSTPPPRSNRGHYPRNRTCKLAKQ